MMKQLTLVRHSILNELQNKVDILLAIHAIMQLYPRYVVIDMYL